MEHHGTSLQDKHCVDARDLHVKNCVGARSLCVSNSVDGRCICGSDCVKGSSARKDYLNAESIGKQITK